MYDTNSHRELQFTSLSSKLKIKDDLIRECLHICNQNLTNANAIIVSKFPRTIGWFKSFTRINQQWMRILSVWSQSFLMCVTFV
jgi:hypothetical protein